MLSLFFPNPDALRLALASGIIPDDVARDGVSAAPGEPSGLWIQSGATLDKPSLAALAHIGVRPFARPAELPSQAFPCWAAALPLKRLDVEPADSPQSLCDGGKLRNRFRCPRSDPNVFPRQLLVEWATRPANTDRVGSNHQDDFVYLPRRERN